MFENVPPGPPDPVFTLKKLADGDLSPNKVDLGVGVYRNEQGGYHELEAVKQAKKILNERNPGHDYESTIGNANFLKHAAELVLGASNPLLQNGKVVITISQRTAVDQRETVANKHCSDPQVATVQTISGTGANHLAALFLSRTPEFADRTVYIGTPAWGNYESIFSLVGVRVAKYKYYDAKAGINFAGMLEAVEKAPARSIFILQSCCHNPTGADLTKAQWDQLAESFSKRVVLPFFDIAYQGLGEGLDDDNYGIKKFVALGLEVMVAQSFAKNFGLYGERAGALHVVGKTKESTDNVRDQLRSLIRAEFSSSPAYGSRLVTVVLENKELAKIWRVDPTQHVNVNDSYMLMMKPFGRRDELDSMRERLLSVRRALYNAVVNEQRVPGDWTVITSTRGLFCYLPLNQEQCVALRDEWHVHLPPSTGRINVAGLNTKNIDYVAKAINNVVKGGKSSL